MRAPSSWAMNLPSADGTEIAVHRRGQGRPLVLVHGSACDSSVWARLADQLDAEFELFILDRRGCGASEPGRSSYALEREAEDIIGVLDHAGPQAMVLAHSWGARCALAAIGAGARPAGAILYEPLDTVDPHYRVDQLEHFARIECEVPPDEALHFYFGVLVGIPADARARMVGGEEWQMARAALGTLARESRAWLAGPIDTASLAGADLPVRVLVGTRSVEAYHAAGRRLIDALPKAAVVALDGQGHGAHLRAPELVAAVVRDLAGETDSRRSTSRTPPDSRTISTGATHADR